MFGKKIKTAIFKLTDLKKLKVLDFHILLSKTHSSDLYFQYGLKIIFGLKKKETIKSSM